MLHLICCVRAEHYAPIARYADEQALYADIAATYNILLMTMRKGFPRILIAPACHVLHGGIRHVLILDVSFALHTAKVCPCLRLFR